MAKIFSTHTKNDSVIPLDLIITFNYPANGALYTPLPGTIQNAPTNGNQPEVIAHAPPDEQWLLDEVYASSSAALAGSDGYVTFNVNGKATNMQFGPLSDTLPTLFGQLQSAEGISVPPNGAVQVFFLPSVTQTVAATVTAKVRFKRVPKGYAGVVPTS